MSYAENPLSEQNSPPGRTPVQHLTVTENEAGQRLDNYLLRRLSGLPRSRIYRLIRKGEVRVNGRRTTPEARLKQDDAVRVPPVRTEPADARRRPDAALIARVAGAVIHEDPRLLVVDKPAGLAVHGGSGISFGLIEALRAARPEETLELVHRLDRDTSGCLLIARQGAALRTLHALLREEGLEKRYLTLLQGKWDLGTKRIDVPLRTDTRVGGERTVRAAPSGKPSVSVFRPVQFFGKTATLMEVSLQTGRTHQIRVHAQHAGHPVAGDDKYGDAAFNQQMRALGLGRMFLHAHSLGFHWPQGGELSVNTPLPADLGAVVEALTGLPRPRGAARRPARSAAAR